jgi:hypothetical protein
MNHPYGNTHDDGLVGHGPSGERSVLPFDQKWAELDVEQERQAALMLPGELERFKHRLKAMGWTSGDPGPPSNDRSSTRGGLLGILTSWPVRFAAAALLLASLTFWAGMRWQAAQTSLAADPHTVAFYKRDSSGKIIGFNQSTPPVQRDDPALNRAIAQLKAAYDAYEDSKFSNEAARMALDRAVAAIASRYPQTAPPFKVKIWVNLGRADLARDKGVLSSSKSESIRGLYREAVHDCIVAPAERYDDFLAYTNNQAHARTCLIDLANRGDEKAALASLAEEGAYTVVVLASAKLEDPLVFGTDGSPMAEYVDTYVRAAEKCLANPESEMTPSGVLQVGSHAPYVANNLDKVENKVENLVKQIVDSLSSQRSLKSIESLKERVLRLRETQARLRELRSHLDRLMEAAAGRRPLGHEGHAPTTGLTARSGHDEARPDTVRPSPHAGA